jgi:hybrid cluster-associated redox disulfide protein
MACLGCPGGSLETLEEAAEAHSVSLEKLLEELNK